MSFNSYLANKDSYTKTIDKYKVFLGSSFSESRLICKCWFNLSRCEENIWMHKKTFAIHVYELFNWSWSGHKVILCNTLFHKLDLHFFRAFQGFPGHLCNKSFSSTSFLSGQKYGLMRGSIITFKAVMSSIPYSDQLYCDMIIISHPGYIR